MAITLDGSWVLAHDVALRPEPFGALAYHFGTRRLTFLKRPELVKVVGGLSEDSSVQTALESANIPEPQWPAYLQALDSLASTGMITRCPERNAS